MVPTHAWDEPAAQKVQIDADALLRGELVVSDDAAGIVVLVHSRGSGPGHAPSRERLTRTLGRARLGTLCIDLSLESEPLQPNRPRVDVQRLAERLVCAARWLALDGRTRDKPVGYFAAGQDAAVALNAAALDPERVVAVVSQAGRLDFVEPHVLGRVEAPTLLLVGSLDSQLIALQRVGAAHLRCEHALELVARAGRDFEEPGALERAVRRARGWHLGHMSHVALAKRYVRGAADGDGEPQRA